MKRGTSVAPPASSFTRAKHTRPIERLARLLIRAHATCDEDPERPNRYEFQWRSNDISILDIRITDRLLANVGGAVRHTGIWRITMAAADAPAVAPARAAATSAGALSAVAAASGASAASATAPG